MKKVVFVLFVFFLGACSNSSEVGNTDVEIIEGPEEGSGKFEFTYYENSSLEIVSNNASEQWANIKDGDNLVFEYHFVFDDELMIADDEYSESIRFEVDAGLTDFSYNPSDLETLKVTLTRACFCLFSKDADYKFISPTGNITGKKLSETQWEVALDVLFYGDEKRTITAIYDFGVVD